MFKKIANSFKESYNELVHKVTWPTSKELSSSAVVVLTASLLIALVVFLKNKKRCLRLLKNGTYFVL